MLRHILFELLKNSISDEGGGIARKNINRIWDYFYSTSKIQFLGKDGTDFGVGASV